MDSRKIGEQVWSACGCIEKIGQKIGWLFYIFPLGGIFFLELVVIVQLLWRCRAWAGDRFDMFIVLMDLMDCWRV